MIGIWLLIAAFFVWGALYQFLAKPGMMKKTGVSQTALGDGRSPPHDPAFVRGGMMKERISDQDAKAKDEFFERLMRDRVFRFRAAWAVLAILAIFALLPINWLAACLAGIGIALLARGIEKKLSYGLTVSQEGEG